ncbi:hypothetical protein EUX98_g4164 [Antrodiella citrinella]|uniref:HMG box domain-containing protein n=1 Tax=Antrodiella citrinella TaxID=2447956 RepID=A0A4S4MX52_9APHY|nr:hypothetical protein EUX98_g4164 [Antrodiella citrinella]
MHTITLPGPGSTLALFSWERKMLMKDAKNLWAQLSEVERQPYVDKSNALKEEYRVRKLEYALHLQKDTLNNVVPREGQLKLSAVRLRAKKVRLWREYEQVNVGHDKMPPFGNQCVFNVLPSTQAL